MLLSGVDGKTLHGEVIFIARYANIGNQDLKFSAGSVMDGISKPDFVKILNLSLLTMLGSKKLSLFLMFQNL